MLIFVNIKRERERERESENLIRLKPSASATKYLKECRFRNVKFYNIYFAKLSLISFPRFNETLKYQYVEMLFNFRKS